MCWTGVHDEAKTIWIEQVTLSCEDIMNAPYTMERRRILERIAGQIRGIGQVTIDNTLAEIEDYIAELRRQ